MFGILSSTLKYIFITIIYIFLFSIIRLIYLDIRMMNKSTNVSSDKVPYLKLINRRDSLNYKVEESYILDGTKVLGRLAKNEISIQDPYLSSTHAEISLKDGVCFIRDLGSTNRTYVNNKAVDGRVALINGDKIQVGQLTFLFVDEN